MTTTSSTTATTASLLRYQQQQQPQEEERRAPARTWTTMPLQPQDPLPETHQAVFDDCIAHPIGYTVLPYAFDDDQADEYGDENDQEFHIDVVRTQDPQQAYVKIDTMRSKDLDHHAPGWGSVYFAFVVHRLPGQDNALSIPTFQAPSPEQVQRVAIKRLNRAVVDEYLRQGGHEDPYKEVSRMQQYGDNIHVLSCVEALQDETYIYIITPYCEHGSLVDCITWQQQNPMVPEDQVCMYFLQLMQILAYLQRHGICHRDLSPDNCMIYQGRLLLADFAMSFRVPQAQPAAEPPEQRPPVTPMGGFGKRAYLPPEVRLNFPFDPYACDLWSSLIVLFNLLTGEILYEDASPDNLKFKYFILAHGVSRTPQNERTTELLMGAIQGLAPESQRSFGRMVQKVLQLSPEVLELLEGVFQVTPHERWTLQQVGQCDWIQRRVQALQQQQRQGQPP